MTLPPSHVREQWAAHNPGLDISLMEVVTLVKKVAGLLDRAIEPLYEGAPLTVPEAELLIPIRYAAEPVIARRLADDMSISRAGISKALAKLERRGFIGREPNPADRRAVLVTITPAGKDAIDGLFPRQVAVETALLEGLGDDRPAVLSALTRLTEVLASPSPEAQRPEAAAQPAPEPDLPAPGSREPASTQAKPS